MKFLPSTADASLFDWVDLLILVLAAVLPAIGVFIWAVFFRKKRRPHNRRRRRRPITSGLEISPANGAGSSFDRENVSGERKS